MEGLSRKEVELISWLEFYEKYFFTSEDVDKFSKDKTQRYNITRNLLKKKRIVKLNRKKYYLVPMKAKSGGWSEDAFILADEIFDGEGYYIAGWSAANYWRLTEQIPMRTEVHTTKRQGEMRVMNTRFIFRRTTPARIEKAVTRKVKDHPFKVMNKEEMKKWMQSRD